MNTQHLVDPELLPALEQIPSFGDLDQTLGDVRRAITGVQIPSGPGDEVSREERFIPGPDADPVRVLIFTPHGRPPAGGLLWFHGGGMVMGEPEQNEPLCRHLAQETGSVVVAVQYRLAPENPYPAGLEDGYAALRWMYEAADEFGFPRQRIAISGESGGGCIAAGLTLLARDRGEFPVSAQFLLYPMLDDRTGSSSEPDALPYSGEFVWSRESNRFAWNAVLQGQAGVPDTPSYAAPARAENLAGLPPTIVFIGCLDLFIADNLRYAQALIRDGVQIDLHVYPGAFHAFITFAQGAAVSQRAFDEFIGALRRHFGVSADSPRGVPSNP